jgi:quercetin dioxygenase-like cupin family protein
MHLVRREIQMSTVTYPEMIESLPDVDVPLEGVRGKLLQGSDRQVAFFDIEPIGEVPLHRHGAQWGIVVEGEMELTIGSETRTYRRGDSYFIPAGVEHGATFKTRFKAIDVFEDVDRYRAR